MPKMQRVNRLQNTLKFLPVPPYKAAGGRWRVLLHSTLPSALDGGQLSDSRSGRFIPGYIPSYTLNWRLGGPQSQPGRLGYPVHADMLQTTSFQQHNSMYVYV